VLGWHPPDASLPGGTNRNLTQFLDRLVYCKARCISCKFEQRSARFANIERREIFAVVHIDGAGIKLGKLLLRHFHVASICSTKSDMIGNARAGDARPEAAGVTHIDGVAGIRQKTIYRAFFRRRPETEITFDETCRLFRRFGQNSRGTQTP
jgi:hypothetical protein